MGTVTQKTVVETVRHRVEHARPGMFFRVDDFDGDAGEVGSVLRCLVGEGELVRVSRGLYWRGQKTRFGMTHPATLEAAVAVGGPGSGPSGVAAAHVLGLSTQVPAVVEVGVPGQVPEPMCGVRFQSRPYVRYEYCLTLLEVAVLEVLGNPYVVEVSWPLVEEHIRQLVIRGMLRVTVLGDLTAMEPQEIVQKRWAAISL